MATIFVLAFLYINDTVLLVRRCNQSFGQGLYSMIGGKVEEGETARQAIKREVYEETALTIPETSFELVHVLHRKGTETAFIALCFKVDITMLAKPYNNEPEKHDDMRFFQLCALPENIISAHKQVIELIQQHSNYSEHGWSV